MSTDTSVHNTATILFTNHVRTQRFSGSKAFVKRLITRKPMVELHIEMDTDTALRHSLNWIQLTAIGLGGIISMGIFELSGQAAAKYSGPAVIISFIISGIAALLSALSFSELMAIMPISGAAYSYTYIAFGEYLAWFIGWNYALLYQLAALPILVSWSKYVVHLAYLISNQNATSLVVEAPVVWNEGLARFFVTGQVLNLPAIAITIAITILLLTGIRPMAMVNVVLVVIKIISLLIFIFVCYKYVNRDNYTPFFPPNQGSFSAYGITGMFQACTYVFFAYVGFDTIASVAQEAKSPERILPLATIASIIISFVIYIGICTVMVGLVPYKLLNVDDPLAETIKATPHGLCLMIVMDLGAIVSLADVILTTLLAQTRIFYAMACDGLLPPIFAKVSSPTDIPWVSTVIIGAFCAVLSGVFPVDIIGETTSISALITYFFIHIEVIVMRYTHPDMQRTFQVPFGSWLIPIIGALLCILLMTGITKGSFYRFLVWTALGQIVYFSYGFWHSHRRPRRPPASINSTVELMATVGTTMATYTQNEANLDLDDESIENASVKTMWF